MKSWKVFCFAIALAAAITLMALFRARAVAMITSQRDLPARAQLIAFAFDRTLQTRLSEVFTFSALPSLRGFAASDEASRPARIAAGQSELRAIVAADAAIRAVSIVDTNGKVILTTDDSMNADWSNRVFVREGLVGHLYSAPLSRDFGEVSQYYSAPIIDNFGNVGGVLILRVLGQELWNAAFAVPNILIVDENGVRIADATLTPQTFTAIAPLANDAIARVAQDKLYGEEIAQIRVVPFPDLALQLQNRRAAQIVLRDPNSGAYLAAIQPLETNPWSVVVLARDDAFGFVSLGYLEIFGWGAISGLLLAVLAYFALK